MKLQFVILLLLFCLVGFSQSSEDKLADLKHKLSEIEKERAIQTAAINRVTWSMCIEELKSYGLPSADYLEHTAYMFEYSEVHEQAKWVMHMITPAINDKASSRTNDFREDPLVLTGTTVEGDYFNYFPNRAEGLQYEGFGYDRGHLAPAADFRWDSEAVSESFYYSNMSPQLADFNRHKWADLERILRGYVLRHNVSLAIVTAPILLDDLSKIEQSPNGVSIPDSFIKIAYDPSNQRTIAFLMDNAKLPNPISSYAVSIDELEELTGYNFFPNIDESLESTFSVSEWFDGVDDAEVKPIDQRALKVGQYNTLAAGGQMNKHREVTVCGEVVSSRTSGSGNAWINLDRKYPNDYFSIMIRKKDMPNFHYDPVLYLQNKKLCVTSEIAKIGGKPVAFIRNPEWINVN